jgi:hypothetical protein
MEVLPSLLNEYHPKDIFNSNEHVVFSLTLGNTYAFQKTAVTGAREIKIGLLCLFVQM